MDLDDGHDTDIHGVHENVILQRLRKMTHGNGLLDFGGKEGERGGKMDRVDKEKKEKRRERKRKSIFTMKVKI